jgi:hypothetical protein
LLANKASGTSLSRAIPFFLNLKTNTMLRKLLAPVFAMFLVTTSFAQDSATISALSITGAADVYYKYDFGETKANNYTSFTNSHNQFQLGMATVKLEHKTSKVDLVADLGFGKRAQEFSYNDDGILQAVKQLYVSYSPTSAVKLTAGTWATHVGYELVDAQLNRNYSMSYMFTNGPFFHTGLKADFTLGKSGVMVGIANPTDFKYVPDGVMNKKFLLAQYSYATSDLFKIYLNYVGGKGIDTAKSNQFDVVISSKLSDKFSIGYNGTLSTMEYWDGNKNMDGQSWWGSALYLNLDPTSKFGLTLRSEYFSDKHDLKIPHPAAIGGCNIFANTLSANFKIDNLTIIPEFRIDNSSEEIFTKKDGAFTKTAANLLLAAVYSF